MASSWIKVNQLMTSKDQLKTGNILQSIATSLSQIFYKGEEAFKRQTTIYRAIWFLWQVADLSV